MTRGPSVLTFNPDLQAPLVMLSLRINTPPSSPVDPLEPRAPENTPTAGSGNSENRYFKLFKLLVGVEADYMKTRSIWPKGMINYFFKCTTNNTASMFRPHCIMITIIFFIERSTVGIRS